MSFHNKSFSQLLNNGTQFTSDEVRRFKSLWKQTPAIQRIFILGTTMDQITKFIVKENKLDHQLIRLSKILSLNISFSQAMDLQLTNYFSYISHLIRSNSLNARSILNEITDFINRIQMQLYKYIQEQIDIYRQLEDDQHNSQLSEPHENGHKVDEVTKVEGDKIKHQSQMITDHSKTTND